MPGLKVKTFDAVDLRESAGIYGGHVPNDGSFHAPAAWDHPLVEVSGDWPVEGEPQPGPYRFALSLTLLGSTWSPTDAALLAFKALFAPSKKARRLVALDDAAVEWYVDAFSDGQMVYLPQLGQWTVSMVAPNGYWRAVIETTLSASVTFPTVTDAVGRADSAVSAGSSDSGHAYTASVGTWGVSSRKLYSVSDTAQDMLTYDLGTPDVEMKARGRGTVASGSAYRSPAVAVRRAAAGTYLRARLRGGLVELVRRISGTDVTLTSAAFVATDGNDYLLELEALGTRLRVLVDGVELLVWTLSGGDVATFGSATRHGLLLDKAGAPALVARWDDVSMTPLLGLTLGGNAPAPLILELTPTAAKPNTADQIYREQVLVAPRSTRPMTIPVAIGLDLQAENTASRLLANGNDLRVIVDGAEVPRWIGDDIATTATLNNTWILLDLPPKRSVVLGSSNAMTATSPATGEDFDTGGDTSGLPDANGVLLFESEAIAYLLRDADNRTLRGITRAVRNTTAAIHAIGVEGYLVTKQIDVVHGWNAAPAPPSIDPDDVPMISFAKADSSNSQWTWQKFATAAGKRPLEWGPSQTNAVPNANLHAYRGTVALSQPSPAPTADGSFNAAVNATATGAASKWQAVATNDGGTSYVELPNANDEFSVKVPGLVFPLGSSIVVNASVVAATNVNATSGAAVGDPFYNVFVYDAQGRQIISSGATITGKTTAATYRKNSFGWTPSRVLSADDLNQTFEVRISFNSDPQGNTNWPADVRLRITQILLEINVISEDDPADFLGLYTESVAPYPGKANLDTWSVAVPVGVRGYRAITLSDVDDNSATTGQIQIVGVPADGVLYVADVASLSAGLLNSTVTATPQQPFYQIGFRSTYTGTNAQGGVSVGAVTALLDTTQTPAVVICPRESAFIHRATITNVQRNPDDAITLLYPSALNTKLTIDADSGVMTYALPGYRPLPALSLNRARRRWLEGDGGLTNALAYADPRVSPGTITVAVRAKARRN